MGIKDFIFTGDLNNWIIDKTTIEIIYFEKEINQFIKDNNINKFELREIERTINGNECRVVKRLTYMTKRHCVTS